MIYFVYGDDHFRVDEQISLLKEAAAKAGANIILLDAREIEPPVLEEALTGSSLFAKKNAVFLKNAFDAPATVKDKLLSLFKKIPAGNSLVVWEEGLPDRRQRLFKTLEDGRSFVKNSLNGPALVRWIDDRATSKGTRLERPAAELLAQTIGNDLRRIDSELEKLSLYAGKRTIRLDDVTKLVDLPLTAGIFDLLDALGRQDSRAGLLIEQLLAGGQEPLYILSMIGYQIRHLLLVHDLWRQNKNLSPGQVASKLGLHPFVAQKTLHQARLFKLNELLYLHRRLTETDAAIKTGDVDAAEALILLVSPQKIRR